MAAKYAPLEHYLRSLPTGQSEINLTFDQIEQLLKDTLPASAHQHQAWWANEQDGMHVQAHSWINAGWMVETVDQRRCVVRFHRA